MNGKESRYGAQEREKKGRGGRSERMLTGDMIGAVKGKAVESESERGN